MQTYRALDHRKISVTGTKSITGGGAINEDQSLQLSGDLASPGASKFYGTDLAGAKGWQPTSGFAVAETIVNAAGMDQTVTANNRCYRCTGDLTIILAAATNEFRTTVLNKGTGTVIIEAAGTDTIEGVKSIRLVNQYQAVQIKGDGVDTHVRL